MAQYGEAISSSSNSAAKLELECMFFSIPFILSITQKTPAQSN
jgi:hypothetical protein